MTDTYTPTEQQLRQEVEALREFNQELSDEMHALRRDAERYRWLRDDKRADVRIFWEGARQGAQLDDAVDAHLSKTK